jgi:hypothetical protein
MTFAKLTKGEFLQCAGGVAFGYTKRGIKPSQRPLIAALAEAKLIPHDWLRSGNPNASTARRNSCAPRARNGPPISA